MIKIHGNFFFILGSRNTIIESTYCSKLSFINGLIFVQIEYLKMNKVNSK